MPIVVHTRKDNVKAFGGLKFLDRVLPILNKHVVSAGQFLDLLKFT